MTELQLDKIHVAKVQIEQAIRSWFNNDNQVAILTLVSAGAEVLYDLMSKKQIESTKDKYLALVKPGFESKAHEVIYKHQNFFKHADRDSSATIAFNTELNEYKIFMAIVDYGEYTGELSKLMDVFAIWFITNNPEYIQAPEGSDSYLKSVKSSVQKIDRDYYYQHADKILEIVRRDGHAFLPQYKAGS